MSSGEDGSSEGFVYDTIVDGELAESPSSPTIEFDDLIEMMTDGSSSTETLGRVAFGDMYAGGPARTPDVILLVDDEPLVLSALSRLLRALHVEVLTAEDAAAALEIMSTREISLLISDEFMPGMSGTELLEIVRESHPLTVRVMITGNDDLRTAIAAINRGDVFRFVNKPWQNEEILQIATLGLEQYDMSHRAARYEGMIRQQNERLHALNEELERRVEARTLELSESREHITDLYSELQQSFGDTLHVMLSMMELGELEVVDHCRRTAERVEAFAEVLGLSARHTLQVTRAALLHWIGLINAPPSLFDRDPSDFGVEEIAIWEFHTLLGYQVLEPIDALRRPGQIILHYLRPYTDERFRRGQVAEGLDDPLDDALIMSCRVLSICSAFEYARTMLKRRGERSEHVLVERGLAEIRRGKGTKFSPDLVDPFIRSIKESMAHVRSEHEVFRVEQLRSGMVLSRRLSTRQGVAVAPRDLMLTQEFIDRLLLFESTGGLTPIFVWGEGTL